MVPISVLEKINPESIQDNSHLSEDQIRQFYQGGYLVAQNFASAADVEQVRTLINSLFARYKELPKHLVRNLVENQDLNTAPRNLEIARCLWLERKLIQTQYFRNATAIARQLLGPEARVCFDHTIFKPPHSNCPTRWHQDEPYNLPGGPRLRASFWLPLQDVTVESGCLQFIPGSHKGEMLPHYPIAAGSRVLTTDYVDVDRAVPCPIRAGDLSIHHGRTLHYAGPNITAQPRMAWILVFAVGGHTPRAQLMRLAAPIGRLFLKWPKMPNVTLM